MSSLTLLGTVHRDPRGFTRLVEELTRLAPGVITVEFSTYGLRYRMAKRRSLNKRLLTSLHDTDDLGIGELKKLLRSSGIGGIKALLNLPFEYKGARWYYSHGRDVPLYCVDISSYSRKLLGHVKELLSPENLKKIVAFETAPLQATVMREYKRAEDLLCNKRQSQWLQPIPMDEVWEKRERIMANRIRKLVAHYPTRHIVHIGGWQHLLSCKGALFNLLEDLDPRRVLLGRLCL
jgi:hypothetical protein